LWCIFAHNDSITGMGQIGAPQNILGLGPLKALIRHCFSNVHYFVHAWSKRFFNCSV